VAGLKKLPAFHNWGINYAGILGVLMFFIHTSLVLMMSMERLEATGDHATIRFYVRRVFRIYPLSMFVVLLVVALKIPSYFEPQFHWPGVSLLLANLFLVQNLWPAPPSTSVTGPLWSLPFEVQMYLLLPLLYLLARRVRTRAGVIGLIGLGFCLMFAESRLARALGYPPLLTYAPWFLMGVSAYAAFRTSRRWIGSRWYVVSLALFVALPCVAYRLILDYRSGWANWGIGIAFAMLLPYFSDIRSAVIRSAAHTLATYSYGVYLSHVPILWFAFQKLHDQPIYLRVMVCLALLVTVPVILYQLLEAPMIRLGAGLARRLVSKESTLLAR
jgi:peptidoglycan/LPS O-acetylase OafA/YrhL